MSDNEISDQTIRDELSSQAAALLQTWRENVDRRTSVSRTFVHLRQEDASRKAIPRRSRMQSLIQEGRVKDIEFSTRHTTGQIANLLSVNMPTLAGVDPTRYFLDDLVNDLNSSRNQLKGLNLIYY